jgi:hypothetical protein
VVPLKKKPNAEIIAHPTLISYAAKVEARIIRRIESKIEDVPGRRSVWI